MITALHVQYGHFSLPVLYSKVYRESAVTDKPIK